MRAGRRVDEGLGAHGHRGRAVVLVHPQGERDVRAAGLDEPLVTGVAVQDAQLGRGGVPLLMIAPPGWSVAHSSAPSKTWHMARVTPRSDSSISSRHTCQPGAQLSSAEQPVTSLAAAETNHYWGNLTASPLATLTSERLRLAWCTAIFDHDK